MKEFCQVFRCMSSNSMFVCASEQLKEEIKNPAFVIFIRLIFLLLEGVILPVRALSGHGTYHCFLMNLWKLFK